jgi:hypothetical protein
MERETISSSKPPISFFRLLMAIPVKAYRNPFLGKSPVHSIWNCWKNHGAAVYIRFAGVSRDTGPERQSPD